MSDRLRDMVVAVTFAEEYKFLRDRMDSLEAADRAVARALDAAEAWDYANREHGSEPLPLPEPGAELDEDLEVRK